MDLFGNLIFGFGVALSLQNLLYCLIGVPVGTLIGVLPGIGPLGTIAMLLPITYSVSPVGALIMLAGIYYGAQYGGSTTAILVNLPGETSAVVTCIDGYQMARQGRAGPALAIAAIGSFFAGTVGTLLIALSGPPLAEIALKFGAPEYFSLMLMGLVAAAVLAQGDMVKSLAMVAMGLLLGIVGTDVNTGMQRFSFGITELTDGIGFIVVAVGVFAVGEIITNLGDTEERQRLHRQGDEPVADAGTTSSARSGRSCAAPARLLLRRAARHRAGDRLVLVLHGGEEARRRSVALRQGRDRGRRGAGIRQQRRRAVQVHPDAHARPAGQRRDGADARRAHHPGHPARAGGDDAAARTVLGPDRQHVDRQPDAGGAQPADDRAVGEAARRCPIGCCSRRSWRSPPSASTASTIRRSRSI